MADHERLGLGRGGGAVRPAGSSAGSSAAGSPAAGAGFAASDTENASSPVTGWPSTETTR